MSLPNIPKRTILLTVATWWLVLVTVETLALVNNFEFSTYLAFADAINLNLLIAAAGYITFISLRYYQPNAKNAGYLIVWDIALSVICTLAHHYIMMNAPFPLEESYVAYLIASRIFRGILVWLMITLIGLISWIWFFLQDLRATEKRDNDTVKLAREAELASLRQQLQPHFLFNSLNSISALAGSKPEAARNMIQQLSDFLRGTIKKDDQQLVSLHEELKHLGLYLEIEKVRFGHRLKTEIVQTEDTKNSQLPSLLLQPLVENAIKFGLYDTIGEITISIFTKIEERRLVITIENPFDSQTSHPRHGTGFGLNSVQRRLYLLYARNDLLSTRQTENKFITEVKIPQQI
ncbi:MAG: histidine kinase [Chryseolinea sp.]